MTLDLTQVDTDTPEMREFKENTARVMRELAKKHGWCDVAEKGLKQANIVGDPVVHAVADVTVTLKIGIDIPIDEYKDLTPAQQNAKAAEAVEKLIKSPFKKVKGSDIAKSENAITKVKVTDLNKYVAPPAPAAPITTTAGIAELFPPPEGYALGFTSSEGRTAHIVRANGNGGPSEGTRALCGDANSRMSNYYGFNPRGNWMVDSYLSEGRVCARCTTKAETLVVLDTNT